MTGYTGRLACVRCGAEYPEAQAFSGCPACQDAGAPSNLAPVYHLDGGPLPVQPAEPGLFRYRPLLPLAPDDVPVSLGEGRSPLLPLPEIGEQFGLRGLWIKDESRGPTWSYKDRLAAVAVTKARASGADTAVVSTTGNHGAAVAAYCAAAGLRCVALTLTSVPATMRTLMQVYGAQVVAYAEPQQRWTVMAAVVAEHGWVPMSGFVNPPIGSNPFGIEGYKSLAYEVVDELGVTPDVVIVPTAYADGLSGITRGFDDLHRLGVTPAVPRMVAAEPFGPYSTALHDGSDVAGPVPVQPSVAFSIAGSVGTYQGLHAIRSTGGRAVAIGDDEEIMAMQAQLARTNGLYLEASSVLPLLAARQLAESGEIRPGDRVVVIGTSTGLKDVGATAARLPEPPVAEPTLAALDEALRRYRTTAPVGMP